MAASTFDDRLKRAVDTLGDRLGDEITRELRMVTEELSTARVLVAVRALDEAGSLSAVLDTLVARASLEAARTRLFLLRTDGLRAWREDERVGVRLVETDMVAEAIRTKRAVSTTAVAGVELHAFPLALSGDVVAVLCVEGGDVATLDVLSRYAARVLESLTAFKTVRALAASPSVAASQASGVPAGNEEIAARRYARLLYGKRVPADVPHAADFFRDELVRTLAGGDASLLVDVSAA